MRRSGAIAVAALLAALALPAPARAKKAAHGVAGPVAVLPFKNVNRDPKLDWLSVGIAETMVSDVKRSGAVEVVERDQIDKALAQIALQGEVKMAPSTAVKVGKIVGARTIVLGAYQEAGHRIRITARFVSVETGVVTDAAKVTGPLTRIFHLQDAIVGRLLGVRHGHRYRPPKREKGTARTVKAYRLYAMSLQVASDATRVSYLKHAVKVDPHFHYAVDALDALEKKLRRYDLADLRARQVAAPRLLAEIGRPGLGPEARVRKARALLQSDLTGRRYQRLAADAGALMKMSWPKATGPFSVSVPDEAGYMRFLAYRLLERDDLALQYGRSYLKAHLGGTYYDAVRRQMTVLIQARRRASRNKPKLKADLAEIAKDRKAYLADQKRRHQPPDPARLRQFGLRRCAAAADEDQYRVAVHLCRAYIRGLAADADPGAARDVHLALVHLMRAHAQLGQFDAAYKIAHRLRREAPGLYQEMGIAYSVRSWPQR